MLTYFDKEFIRAQIERTPIIMGSRLRAVKAAIALRRLLLSVEGADFVDTDPDSIRHNTLKIHDQGVEMTPAEMRDYIEVFNLAVEASRI